MPSNVTILKVKLVLQSSNLPQSYAAEPLTTIAPPAEVPGSTYTVQFGLYIPEPAIPGLNYVDFNTIGTVNTEAGDLSCRMANIEYTYPATPATSYAFWTLEVEYTVNEAPGAQAIFAYYTRVDGGLGETSRGTVTTVKRT